MNNIEEILTDLIEKARALHPKIICLYTGAALPGYCDPMPRFPTPPIGMKLDHSFANVVVREIKKNPSLHDGALLFGRPNKRSQYELVGWSYRMFPPTQNAQGESNRGSAFNSCLAMSKIVSIDAVYLVASDGMTCFEKGRLQRKLSGVQFGSKR